jgi:hypothetical protein
MPNNQAVSGQFDLDATPLTVSGASGIGDEARWRTRRASVYKIADPGRPNWKSRLKCRCLLRRVPERRIIRNLKASQRRGLDSAESQSPRRSKL